MLTELPRLPKPSELFDPLTSTLGRYSGFRAEVEVHMDRAFFPTLDRYGIDEETRQAYQDHDMLYGPERAPHRRCLHRKYQLAFRYMKDGPVRGELRSRVFQARAQYYQLTEFGASIARKIYERSVDQLSTDPARSIGQEENLTRIWFDRNWKDVEDTVRKYLNKPLRKSRAQGLMDDHIHHFIARAIAKDSFRRFLTKGGKIYPSTLALFIRRSAYTEMRTWGSDASCRALRGAVNERDRRLAREFYRKHPNYENERMYLRDYKRTHNGLDRVTLDIDEDGEDESCSGALMDCYGNNLEDLMVDAISASETVEKMAAVLDEDMGIDGQAHFNALVAKHSEGRTYDEVAETMGVSRTQATMMVRRAKRVIDLAQASGSLT